MTVWLSIINHVIKALDVIFQNLLSDLWGCITGLTGQSQSKLQMLGVNNALLVQEHNPIQLSGFKLFLNKVTVYVYECCYLRFGFVVRQRSPVAHLAAASGIVPDLSLLQLGFCPAFLHQEVIDDPEHQCLDPNTHTNLYLLLTRKISMLYCQRTHSHHLLTLTKNGTMSITRASSSCGFVMGLSMASCVQCTPRHKHKEIIIKNKRSSLSSQTTYFFALV